MKKLLTLSLLSLSFYSVSDGHPEGAFNTLFVKANDVDRYVTYMKITLLYLNKLELMLLEFA